MFVDPCIIVHFLQRKLNKMQQCNKILLFLILNEAQHVSGETPLIIRSLKLHKQPLVLHNIVEGCRTCSCWTLSGSVISCTMMHGSTNIKFSYLHSQLRNSLNYPPFFSFFAVALRPNAGHGLLFLRFSRLHTTTHHRR